MQQNSNISLTDISDNDISLGDTYTGGGDSLGKQTPLTEALFYILLAVRKPNHGYGIIQEIEKITKHRLVLGPGTLYGAIQSLEKKGWIEIYSEDTASRKKKEYIITEAGRQAFSEEQRRLEELIANASLMQETDGGEI